MGTLNRILVETGRKKSFATALDWPGWSRSGPSEESAISALVAYADRYRKVADRARTPGIDDLIGSPQVTARVTGSGATDFGVPDKIVGPDEDIMSPEECDRQLAILQACWEEFDDVAESVSEELQKGPRGGGRDRAAIVEHTLEADRGYARRIGVNTPKGYGASPEGRRRHRDEVVQVVRAANLANTETRWPLRYFIRRAAWHLLDHAWEMEDKDLSGQNMVG